MCEGECRGVLRGRSQVMASYPSLSWREAAASLCLALGESGESLPKSFNM